MSDLRSRQRQLARRAILDALAELVRERRHLDFSLQEVAERAGVSLRTVYNHFSGREALIDALGEHFNVMLSEAGGVLIGEVDDVDGLLDAAGRNFRLFEDMAGLSEAWVVLDTPAKRDDHDRRTERMLDLLAGAMPDAGSRQQRLAGIVVRHLVSQRSWYALTRDYGLDVEEAVTAAVWACRAVLEAAGDLPVDDEEGPDGPDVAGPRRR